MTTSHETPTPSTLSPEYIFPPTPIEEASKQMYPEGNLRSPEEVAQAIEFARKAVGSMTSEVDFRKALAVEPSVDPIKDRYTTHYWAEFSNYASSRVYTLRKYGLRGQPVDPLKLDAMSLVAQAPIFVHAELAIDAHRRHQRGGLDNDSATQYNSAFRDNIRDFAREYPQADVDPVHAALISASLAATAPETRLQARRIIDHNIRDTKHALAFGDILDNLSAQTGRQYRRANTVESANKIDYVTDPDTKWPLYLEVEPSAKRLDITNKPNNAFIPLSSQHAIIHSLTDDKEFQRGKFFIPEELAAQKAAALNNLLTEIRLAA